MSIDAPDETTLLERVLDVRSLDGPAWRWNRAGEYVHARPGKFLRQLGQEFSDLHHYRRLCAHSPVGKKHAQALYPDIAAAENLNADDAKAGLLKVAALGEIGVKEVSEKVQTDVAVIRAWESAFFDVRGLDAAIGWVQTYVILPELEAGRADLAARLRMVAAIGPRGAEAILLTDTRIPLNEAQRLFERRLRLHLKHDAVLNMLTDSEVNRRLFIRQHAQLMFEEKRLAVACQKLENKCAEAIDRHKLAMIRTELALERERNRATANALRAEEIAILKAGEQASRRRAKAQRQGQGLLEKAALAARVARSPLARLRWRRSPKPAGRVRATPEMPPHGTPSIIATVAVPLTVLSPGIAGPLPAAVPV